MNMVTGDDFGISHEVNEAVEAHYQAGWLSQASLMIHGRHGEEALRIARRNPGLCIGLHLTLCAGSRTGRTLLTDPAGNFEPSPGRAGWRYFWKRSLRGAIREEIEEQFARFSDAGLPPVYWDGHTHLHLHPVIMREAVAVASSRGFRAVRLVQTRDAGWTGRILNWLSAAAKSRLAETGIRYAEQTWGLKETGKMNDESYAKALEAAKNFALSEIYYHPGVDGPGGEKAETGTELDEIAPPNFSKGANVKAEGGLDGGQLVSWATILTGSASKGSAPKSLHKFA